MIGFRSVSFGVAAIALQLLPAAAEDVRISPTPGVSLLLNKEWQTCDDDTRGKLGSDKPTGVRALVCTAVVPSNPSIKMAAFGPGPDHKVMLLFRDLGKTILTQHAIATTTEALLVEFKASSKDIWAAEHPGGNATLNSLDVRVDKLGERYALVTSISSTANSGVVSMAEQWDVYLAGKHFQLHLTWPKDADVSVKPALDALKASVKFE